MAHVEVIGLPQSNYVWAVRIALAEKGVAHESVPAPPHSPAVRAVHPLGKIPVLRHGEVALAESRAIIDHIDAAFEGPRLVPADGAARRADDLWTSIVQTTIEPLLIRRYVLAYLLPRGADGRPDEDAIRAMLPEVEAALDVLERGMASGDLGGEVFTRVDAYLVPILFYVRMMREGGGLIAERARLSAYLDRHVERPSVRDTMPPPPAGGA